MQENKSIDRIERVSLRKVWAHEAHDFTKWLAENLDLLKEVIGVELLNAETEAGTGNFNVDIKCEDESGKTVIIENQLEKSNHDHLGKVITYLAAFEASKAVWIVSDPRQEHIKAFEWLNEIDSGCDFYLLKIEGVKIGNSNPAPLLTLVSGPSEEAKQYGKIRKEDSERHKLRFEFWSRLLEYQKSQPNKIFRNISPSKDTWIGTSSGVSGISYNYWLTQHTVRIEIRIDLGREKDEENLILFNKLRENQSGIEASFGEPLEWNEAEGYRVCIVRKNMTIGGYLDSDKMELSIKEAVESMNKLHSSTIAFVKKLKS